MTKGTKRTPVMTKAYREWFTKTPKTRAKGLILFHPEVHQLGPSVADNVANLIQLYTQRTSLASVPPITLDGPGWGQSFEIVGALEPCHGNAGSSYEASRKGSTFKSLLIGLPFESAKRDHDPDHSKTLEGIIAHEITHLRWWNLEHGKEFTARVRALLKGCNFPPHSGWNNKTRAVMAECRQEAKEHMERVVERIRAEPLPTMMLQEKEARP
jgi:hypothetical protein